MLTVDIKNIYKYNCIFEYQYLKETTYSIMQLQNFYMRAQTICIKFSPCFQARSGGKDQKTVKINQNSACEPCCHL